jgi:hypothetical protein
MFPRHGGTFRIALVRKKSPARGEGFLLFSVQRNNKIRMISGIGIPTSQSRMGM